VGELGEGSSVRERRRRRTEFLGRGGGAAPPGPAERRRREVAVLSTERERFVPRKEIRRDGGVAFWPRITVRFGGTL
jgi:hypothetical protein